MLSSFALLIFLRLHFTHYHSLDFFRTRQLVIFSQENSIGHFMRIVSKKTGFDISCKLSSSKTVLRSFFRTLIQSLVTIVLIFNLKVLFAYTYQILRSPFRTGIQSLGPLNINIPVLLSAPRTERLHYTKTRLFKYIENFTTKKLKMFRLKTLILFIFLLKT